MTMSPGVVGRETPDENYQRVIAALLRAVGGSITLRPSDFVEPIPYFEMIELPDRQVHILRIVDDKQHNL